MNSKQLFANNWIIALFVSTILASTIGERSSSDGFLNTIYTISGIMFSIGMGILCTLNPQSIKNESIYLNVKEHILAIRNSYLIFFANISITYLLYQILKNTPYTFYAFDISGYQIVFDLYYLTSILNILSILYFTINFIQIQKLNFDISYRGRS